MVAAQAKTGTQMDLYIDAVTEDFLPDEVLLNVLSFLDVESNLVVSLVSRRYVCCCRYTSNIC